MQLWLTALIDQFSVDGHFVEAVSGLRILSIGSDEVSLSWNVRKK